MRLKRGNNTRLYHHNLSRLKAQALQKMRVDDSSHPAALAGLTRNELLVGVGPGTSGTRSLFVALAMLGVGDSHYKLRYYPQNCAITTASPTDDVFLMVGEAEDKPKLRFWGDSPVSWQWPALRRRIPNAKFIMTDANATTWVRKRAAEHCAGRDHAEANGVDCLVPLPFEPDAWLFPGFHVKGAKAGLAEAAFAAYRSFVRCTVDPSRLLWIDFAQPFETAKLWTDLITFLDIDASAQIPAAPDGRLQPPHATPFPHFGHDSGCQWGGDQCCAAICTGQSCASPPAWVVAWRNASIFESGDSLPRPRPPADGDDIGGGAP